MIKIKATYNDLKEKETLLQELSKAFKVVKVSKDYQRGSRALNDIYIDVSQK